MQIKALWPVWADAARQARATLSGGRLRWHIKGRTPHRAAHRCGSVDQIAAQDGRYHAIAVAMSWPRMPAWFTDSGAICMHGRSASTLAWMPRDHG